MTPQVIAKRKPVWLVLSELYLDTELEEGDFIRIADVLRAGDLSWREAQKINIEEVAPVVIFNLWSVAGAWIGFNEEPLYEAILIAIDKGPPSLFWSKALWRRLVEWHLKDYLPRLAQYF